MLFCGTPYSLLLKAGTNEELCFKVRRMSVFFATLLPWHMSVSFFTAHSPHFCIPTLHFCFGLRHASLDQHSPCIHRSQFSLRQHPCIHRSRSSLHPYGLTCALLLKVRNEEHCFNISS